MSIPLMILKLFVSTPGPHASCTYQQTIKYSVFYPLDM